MLINLVRKFLKSTKLRLVNLSYLLEGGHDPLYGICSADEEVLGGGVGLRAIADRCVFAPCAASQDGPGHYNHTCRELQAQTHS